MCQGLWKASVAVLWEQLQSNAKGLRHPILLSAGLSRSQSRAGFLPDRAQELGASLLDRSVIAGGIRHDCSLVFPVEGDSRGLNEGSYPWDHDPEAVTPAAASSITNGTVAVPHDEASAEYTMTNAGVAASTGGQLTVTYQARQWWPSGASVTRRKLPTNPATAWRR
jgi:hypothetical protein